MTSESQAGIFWPPAMTERKIITADSKSFFREVVFFEFLLFNIIYKEKKKAASGFRNCS